MAAIASREQLRHRLWLAIGFALSSYVVQSLWGVLGTHGISALFSARRVVLCAAGALIFFVIAAMIDRRPASRPKLLLLILAAGVLILAIRLALDFLLGESVPPQSAARWALAWTGTFGIWLLAIVPAVARRDRIARGGSLANVPDAYLEWMFNDRSK